MNLYKESGVDVEKADHLLEWLKEQTPQSNLGNFAGLFPLESQSFGSSSFLVATTDGVGTKLLLAIEWNRLDTIGFDLVAMCLNDLYTLGATPLFFLDYFATGKLSSEQFKTVLHSIQLALKEAKTTLLGGETAEMPGLYKKTHFDLAGFAVGIVDKKTLLGPHKVSSGDILIALPSSGFHSNGFSLLRKWLTLYTKNHSIPEKWKDYLLTPTKIYYEIIEILKQSVGLSIHAIAHITGGGLENNLSRVLPKNCSVKIDFEKISMPSWMRDFILLFQKDFKGLDSIFNLGVGMILVIEKEATENIIQAFEKENIEAYPIGYVK